jgi:FKBP-type peptidyl-prolyl cis-trans isomerase
VIVRRLLLGALVCAVFAMAGCGSSEDTGTSHAASVPFQKRMHQQQIRHRAAMRRHARMAVRRQHLRMMARRHHHAEVRQLRAEEAERAAAEEAERAAAEEAEAEEAAAEEEASECDPNYSGACLDPYASDYDCAGGSGNGPDYTGTVTVVGEDHYGLDADGDGIGCEAE